eukprot:GEMP01062494.1.p1 GENE.GEMP01062494.1~~GEMP01062494.1.p1  ORF type:complete len:334 (+),score=71.95 GEMP01062494.1:82-1083(+)
MGVTRVQHASEQFGSDWWNDSCNEKELSEAVSKGASGCTSNPVILCTVLEQEKEKWIPILDQMIKEYPTASESAVADRMFEAVIKHSAKILEPVHTESKGTRGYLSAQLNPQLYRDTEEMVAQGRRIAAVAPNVMVKVVATEAGVAAIEELTYYGVTINATLSFTVSQAIATAEAVERGLKRRQAEGKSIDAMGPVITVMVGRVDDALRKVVDKQQITVDPGHLNWAGCAVFKKVWAIFQERNYRARPLAAAYRCHFHWSQVLGPNLVTSMPYKWWKQFDADTSITTARTIDVPVDAAIMETLKRIPDFDKFYSSKTKLNMAFLFFLSSGTVW